MFLDDRKYWRFSDARSIRDKRILLMTNGPRKSSLFQRIVSVFLTLKNRFDRELCLRTYTVLEQPTNFIHIVLHEGTLESILRRLDIAT